MRGGRIQRRIMMAVCVCAMGAAHAQGIGVPRPLDGESVKDLAEILSPAEETQIGVVATALRIDQQVPLAVVTVSNLARMGIEPGQVKNAAKQLLEQWYTGGDEGAKAWARGAVLVVSRDEKTAAAAVGPEWFIMAQSQCDRAIRHAMLTRLEAGKIFDAILLGVQAIDGIARGVPVTTPEFVVEVQDERIMGREPTEWYIIVFFGSMLFLLAAVILGRVIAGLLADRRAVSEEVVFVPHGFVGSASRPQDSPTHHPEEDEQ